MRLLATIRPETRDPERYQCLRCGIWRVKKSGRSTRYCIDCLSVEPTPGGEGVGPLRDTDREVYIGDVLTDPAWKGLPARQIMRRVGKKRAGRVLDGLTHDGYPGGEPS